MAIHVVAVDWACYGEIEIDANSMEEAITKVETDVNTPLPDGDYIDGSFRVNREITELLNEEKE